MPFEIGGATDVGRRRTGNEDSFEVVELPDGGVICVVADGMGGHQAGEVASRLAVETIRGTLGGGSEVEPEALVRAVQSANRMVYVEAGSDPQKQGMGTTIVCALLRDGRATLVNVGDSPALLVRGETAAQVTHDHSWVAEEIERGSLQPEDAASHPYRHILTRSLGIANHVEVEEYEPLELQPGDVLVLCSDGLSEHVPPEDLPDMVADRTAAEAAEALVALANERGGSDNITVVVARWTA
jgi:PPM family protein phosphatase